MPRLSVIISIALIIGSIIPTGLAGPTYSRLRRRSCKARSKSATASNPPAGASGAGSVIDIVSSTAPVAALTEATSQPTQIVQETSASVAPAPENTSSAKPAPNPSSAAPPPSGDAPSGDIATYLKFHNDVRAKHGAEPLVWDANLASKAQTWADKCDFVHSGGSLGPFGENLAAGTGDFGIQQGIESWTNEVSEYNPSAPEASHFTQVVWKASKQLGCAIQSCNGIFDPKFGPAQYIVCEYFPAGNDGTYAQNVQV